MRQTAFMDPAFPEPTYHGPERRHFSKTNNGARAGGRRLIDRVSRPQIAIPPWLMVLAMLLACWVAMVLIAD